MRNKKNIFSFSIPITALLILSTCLNASLFAQTQDTLNNPATPARDSINTTSIKTTATPKKDAPQVLTARVLQRDVLIKEADILSNTLSVINYSDQPVDFLLNVNTPYNWTDISDNTLHHLNPGDSIFIPVRVIPSPEVKGGTQYVINTFLVSPQGNQLATDYFFAHTQRINKWFLTVSPQNRIYFLNHCDTASFQLNVANNGNHTEDILLTLQNVKKQGVITDTSGRILHTNYYNFQVNPMEDTTLGFKMKYTGEVRNFRTVDLEGYSGQGNNEAKTFTVWATGQEAKKTDSTEPVEAKNITFVKLNDESWANPYSGEVLPLTVDMNVYNVLGAQPIMNLNLHGDAYLDNQAHLVYTSTLYYTTYYLQNNYFNGGSFYAGYFDKDGNDIQVGQIGMPYSYGVSLGGWGVEGDYHINLNNTVGGMLVDGYNNTSLGAGAWYKHKFMHISPLLDKQIFITDGGIINDRYNKILTYFLTESGGLNITNTQHLSFSLTGIDKDYYRNPTQVIFFGGVVNLGYTGSFMQRRLSISDYFTKASYDTTIYNKNRTSLSNSITYQVSPKWRLQMQNVYYSYFTPIFQTTPMSYSFNNDMYFIHDRSRNVPYIFYDIFRGDNVGLDYFGLGDRYSYFNRENNFMLQAGIQAGYNHLRNYIIPVKDYFTAQPSLLIKYHTISFLAFYTYGPNGIPSPNTFSYAYPQLLLISMHQQYQFLNKHFVLDHGFNYNYFNQFSSHSLTYAPELYYFTNGWRFKFGFNYSFNSTNVSNALIYSGASIPNESLANVGPQTSNNIYLNFGIKKEFGIPIPKKWVKHEYKTVLFISFLDVNGNGKKDPGETVLENVVVSIISKRHRYEALTNEKGEAKIFNLGAGEYYESIQSLQDLKGWFSTSSDSINVGPKDTVYVPFSKGVKLFGAIIYHPSQYSITPTIDLSHIQISVTDSTGKGYGVLTNSHGEFMVYVPSGKYTVTMNEDWMDGNFKVAQNNITLNLSNGIDNLYQSFFITEKASKTEVKDFNQPANNTPSPIQPDQVPHH